MKLFEPITIKGMVLPNRIVFPPMQLGFGFRSQKSLAFYTERARGGAGTIIAAPVPVDILISDDAWGRPGRKDLFIDNLRTFTEAVHQAGTKVGLQLWHGNKFPAGVGRGDSSGESVAPSARVEGEHPLHPLVSPHEEMRALTIPEIELIVDRFGKAAAGAKEGGFDFVEFHGAHGFLLCQFFSPADNHRQDKYGGDIAGRMRLGLECVKAARSSVGSDYPLSFRLSAWEDRVNGITLEDSIRFSIELEKAGVDIINVSAGPGDGRRNYACPTKKHPMGTYAHFAEAIKRRVNVFVVAVGRINLPEVAEDILTKGKADLVVVGRQLIADPFWPRKVAQGRADEIVECISCNKDCWNFDRGTGEFGCRQNPRAGREWEIPAPE